MRAKISFLMVLLLTLTLCASSPTSKTPKMFPKRFPNSADNVEVQRVVNGHLASAGQFPYVAAILISATDGSFFCGASLISDEWILSAAHCVSDGKVTTAYLGGLLLDDDRDIGRLDIAVSTAFTHPDYNTEAVADDIALVRLASKVTFNDRIQPIALPNADDFMGGGVPVILTGYGATSDENSNTGNPNPLEYVELTTYNDTQCLDMFGTAAVTVVCAGGTNKEAACYGDSGSPLAYEKDGQYVQVGIVSFGTGECDTGDPSGYTRVSLFREWINHVTGI